MVLSSQKIQSLIIDGKIAIEPTHQLKDTSIKLHFAEKIVLKPKQFVISYTLEKITLSEGIVGLYDGYAKLAQKGVMTHMGSIFCDSDTCSQITLEIFNASDNEIVLEKSERCGQLVIMETK